MPGGIDGAVPRACAGGILAEVVVAPPVAGRPDRPRCEAAAAVGADVAEHGVDAAELKRVKTQWVASQVYQRDSLFAQARSLGAFWALGLPLDADDQLIERLRAVDAGEVQAVAKKYFGDDQLSVGVLLPQPIDPGQRPRTPPAGALHNTEQR